MKEHNKEMTPAQILEAANKEGYKLSDEELEGIAGGGEWTNGGGQWENKCCPNCGHTGTMYCPGTGESRCGKCGHKW